LLWVAIVFFTSSSNLNADAALAAKLDALLPSLMKEANVPGVAIAVVKDGDTVLTRAYGLQDTSTEQALLVSDVFEGASNGKIIAAYLIHMLAEQGKLTLTDSVMDERIQSACGRPTIESLLTHTAGLGNAINAEQFTVDCELKGRFSYAGEGYVILKDLITKVSSQPSHLLVKDMILTPLAMTRTTMGVSDHPLVSGHPDLLFSLVTGRGPHSLMLMSRIGLACVVMLAAYCVFRLFTRNQLIGSLLMSFLIIVIFLLGYIGFTVNIQVPIASKNSNNDFASSIKTTAPDLAIFAKELMTPILMSADSRNAMLAAKVEVNKGTLWAAGIGMDELDGRTTHWHWGSNPGYQSLMVIDVKNKSAVIVLTNGGGFADFALPHRGGYYLSRKVAREVMRVDGHWSVRPD